MRHNAMGVGDRITDYAASILAHTHTHTPYVIKITHDHGHDMLSKTEKGRN